MSVTQLTEPILNTDQGSEYSKEESAQYAEYETFWRDHQTWLKTAGYILRPRYYPEWVPSWLTDDPNKRRLVTEDSAIPILGSVLDALRVQDGARVMLKKIDVRHGPTERYVAALFATEPLASEPRNHCIPVYDILELPEDSNCAILVMPFLLKFDLLPFICLREIVDFIQQILEGLLLMHQLNISHCDVKINNIMSDTLRLFRVPPHPVVPSRNFWATGQPKVVSTRMEKSVRHYLLDFGLSQHHPPGTPRLQHSGYGGTHSVPEFQNNSEPCDPFAVDVYCMGEFMRTRFRQGQKPRWVAFNGLEFIDELISDMMEDDPKKRPTMDVVVEQFSQITGNLNQKKMMSRVSTIDETRNQRLLRNVRYWIHMSCPWVSSPWLA
ncbi:kinase-like domain-containing protein [Cyathus striatus]|nr:kinase-like domain-containing protein [Cyathus striatus]